MLNALRGRDLKALVMTAGVSYGGTALSVLSAPLLARTVGADGRGVLAAAFVTLQLLSWVSFLGLPRGLALQGAKRSHVSGLGVIVVSLLGIVSAALAFGLSAVFANGDPRIEVAIKIGTVSLLASGLNQLGVELLLLEGKIRAYNVTRSTVLVLPSLGIIAAYFLDALSLQSAYIIMLSGQLLACILGCFFAVSLVRKARRIPVPWDFSLKYWSTSALDQVGTRADQLALSALTQPATLGVYSLAVTCATASAGLTEALNTLAYSKLSQLQGTESKAFLRRRSLLGIACSLASGTMIVLAVHFFGRALFGPTFDGLTQIVVVLVLAQLVADQWALRILADSARETPNRLVLASIIGIAVLGASIAALAVTGGLTGLTMGLVMVLFSAVRLTAWGVLQSQGAGASTGPSHTGA